MRIVTPYIAAALFFALAGSAAVFALGKLPGALDHALHQKLPGVNYEPAFDANNFTDKIDNPWCPLRPGTTMILQGLMDTRQTDERFEVTSRHKTILGVNTLVIHDTVMQAGKPIEETYDWFAQDKQGNVWYFGEQTKALDKGKWTTAGSWQAGVAGARPGIYMQAHPRVGDTYVQEFYQGHSGDSASVVSLGEPISVPHGNYKAAQLTMEWAQDDPGSIDAKYYVSGIGVVKEFAATGAVETMSLVKIETK